MNSGPTLQTGSTGDDVKRVQRILVMIKLLDYTGIDGNYGPNTEAAVESFQESNSLMPDGIVGNMTWQAMPADPDTPELSSGLNSNEILAMQNVLQTMGLYTGMVDGSFGPQTEAAVKAYQTQHSLTADGIVGDLTWWVPAGALGATLASLSGLTTA